MKEPRYPVTPGTYDPARFINDYEVQLPTGLYAVSWVRLSNREVFRLEIAANDAADAAWRAARASFDCISPGECHLLGVETLRGPGDSLPEHNHPTGPDDPIPLRGECPGCLAGAPLGISAPKLGTKEAARYMPPSERIIHTDADDDLLA